MFLIIPIFKSFGFDWLFITSTAHLAAIICWTASIFIGPHSWLTTLSVLPSSGLPDFGRRRLCFLGPDENRLSGGAGGRRRARNEGNVEDNSSANSLLMSSVSWYTSGGWCKLTNTPVNEEYIDIEFDIGYAKFYELIQSGYKI